MDEAERKTGAGQPAAEQPVVENPADEKPATEDVAGQQPAAESAAADNSVAVKPPKPPKTAEQLAWEAARRAHFKSKYWQPFFRPLVALVAICAIASLLLGLTNELTAPMIAAEEARVADANRRVLIPGADTFTLLEDAQFDGVTAVYEAKGGAMGGTGYIIESYGRGYGGRVPAIVAFGPGGDIMGVIFPANEETVGLGQKVATEPSFAAQFAGLPAAPLSLNDIDGIATATISSGAAVTAVNNAVAAYSELAGGALPTTPQAVREYLLPGEALSAITITGDNVQPEAWRSGAGNYIIYGYHLQDDPAKNPVVAAVAMNGDGVILNLWLDTSGEANGATLSFNQDFVGSFLNQSAPVEVDIVADLTGSSNKVMEAVNSALAALPAAKEAV